MKNYDYIIVGAGLAGCSVARLLTDRGYKVKIIEASDSIGGAARTIYKDGIHIHEFGPHIFHTSNEEVWRFIKHFTEMLPFVNSPIANYNGELYNLPFNMNTFYQIFKDSEVLKIQWNGEFTPESVQDMIDIEIKMYEIHHPDFDKSNPSNLEEKAISMVGTSIYNKLVKEYTEKQWGRRCDKLPVSIIGRLPLRFTFDNNYFNDRHQGIPEYGYTEMFENMTEGIEIEFNQNVDFEYLQDILKDSKVQVIFTGSIDKLFNYKYGDMPFRSLKFNLVKDSHKNYQGVAVMNYTSHNESFTRITEHKHFDRNCKSNETWLTFEYPDNEINRTKVPYYPIENELYFKYVEELNRVFGNRVHLLGRAAEWKYLNMDKIVEHAIEFARSQGGGKA